MAAAGSFLEYVLVIDGRITICTGKNMLLLFINLCSSLKTLLLAGLATLIHKCSHQLLRIILVDIEILDIIMRLFDILATISDETISILTEDRGLRLRPLRCDRRNFRAYHFILYWR